MVKNKSNIDKNTEGYTALYNRIQANNVDLTTLDSISAKEFYQKIHSEAKSEGLFRKAQSLARQIRIQKGINEYIENKQIVKIIPKITEKEYIEPYSKDLVFKLTPTKLKGYPRYRAKLKAENTNSIDDVVKSVKKAEKKLKTSKANKLNQKGLAGVSINTKVSILASKKEKNGQITTEIRDFYYNGSLEKFKSRAYIESRINNRKRLKTYLKLLETKYEYDNVQILKTENSIRVIRN